MHHILNRNIFLYIYMKKIMTLHLHFSVIVHFLGIFV